MAIDQNELKYEKEKLQTVSQLLNSTIEELKKEVVQSETELTEFKKMNWEDKSSFDSAEFNQVMAASEQEAMKIIAKRLYFKKLNIIKDKPYFASFIYEEEDKTYNIYMALTYLKDKNYNNILYDWRSPICSIFYDYETGPCSYTAPGGIYQGTLKRKRQYKMEKGQLVHVFDNSINIDDDILQEVLANNSSEKMKNVVNTIQKEQNKVIRNLEDKDLIVQGIAGSGKTSVALHRIAFLLYRIKNLTSNNVLIFSPNDVFTEYISNVLPELGEENTLQTTFSNYLSYFIREYKNIESFTEFISRYYQGKEPYPELVKYKQSKEIMNDIDLYLDEYIKNARCLKDIEINKIYTVSKETINEMLHYKFDRFPFFERIDAIAENLSLKYFESPKKKKASIKKLILENCNFKKDFKQIYTDFFQSTHSKWKLSDTETKIIKNYKILPYEDALLLAYMKGKLEGFQYENNIKQVLIDEAQDYNYLQYYIIKQIFKKADFTILGDINQNINPYFHYNSLNELKELFNESAYLELLKTYRSSKEIIEYTNQILNLKFVSAIRQENNKPVIKKQVSKNEVAERILEDINHLKKSYKSIAVITKDEQDANDIYKELHEKIAISRIETNTKKFEKDLIIISAYMAKGLEYDSVIIYNNPESPFQEKDKNLLYVAATRAQHELYLYNL